MLNNNNKVAKMSEAASTIMFKCAFSEDTHFLSKPIELTCGHHVCKRCVPSDGAIRKKCKLCGKTNRIDLRFLSVSSEMKALVKSNLDELFHETRNNFSGLLTKIKDAIGTLDESVQMQVEYVRTEIEIRVESLKSELDNLNVTLNDQLNMIQDDLFNVTRIAPGVDIKEFESHFTKLNEMLEANHERSHSEFSGFQKQLQLMSKGLSKLKEMKHELKFDVCEMPIDPTFVGLIEYNPSGKPQRKKELPKPKRDPLNYISSPMTSVPDFRREVDLYLKHSLSQNECLNGQYETPRTARPISRQESFKNTPLFDVLVNIDEQKQHFRLQNESPELLNSSMNTISSQLIRMNSARDEYVISDDRDDSWRPKSGRKSNLGLLSSLDE